MYEDDYKHALEEHPGEVSLDSIEKCIMNPDLVVRSKHGNNACLFYEKKIERNYFVVVVHLNTFGEGEIKTAYLANYVKKGNILFKREEK